MYGKIFASMFDGTLGTKGPWQALVTFQQMLVLCDDHGEVDMTPEALSRRTTIPLEIITIGLAALQEPDPDSRSPEEEGRRIVRLSDHRAWGWRIVNYAHYRAIRSKEERREYMREYQRERRVAGDDGRKHLSTPVNNVTQAVSSKQYAVSRKHKAKTTTTSADAERDTDDPAGFAACWSAYPKRAGGNSRAQALKAYRARLASGASPADLLAGTQRYAAFVRQTGKEGSEYVKQAATFYGPGEHYLESWDAPSVVPIETERDRQRRRVYELAALEREQGQPMGVAS